MQSAPAMSHQPHAPCTDTSPIRARSSLLVPILSLLIAISCGDLPEIDQAPAATCDHDGPPRESDDGFPATDGCNQCSCNPNGDSPGQVECTATDCQDLVVCDGVTSGGGDLAAITCSGRDGETWQCECWSQHSLLGVCESGVVNPFEDYPCGEAYCCPHPGARRRASSKVRSV